MQIRNPIKHTLAAFIVWALGVAGCAEVAELQVTPTAGPIPDQQAQATAQPALTPSPMMQTQAAMPITSQNADRIVQRALLGKGWVISVAYSPLGKLLAVASSVGIRLYNAETAEEVRFIPTAFPVSTIAFSPDGQMIASDAMDNSVQLWRVGDGASLRTL
ncbi:MAG: hypothetical protein NZM18_03130, partial [Thermoflexales bacterium]|nr:hypothetical protein [Thermoflexales bacterium]